MHERIGILSNRNPDELLKKKWGDWLATAQTALDLSKEKQSKQQTKTVKKPPIRRR